MYDNPRAKDMIEIYTSYFGNPPVCAMQEELQAWWDDSVDQHVDVQINPHRMMIRADNGSMFKIQKEYANAA